MAEDPIRDQKNLGEFMGNRTLKAGLFAALAAGALWVLPMSAWAAPVFPEGISADGESLAGKTWEDALHTAEEKVKDQAGTSVALTIEDKKAETTAGELGFHWSNQDEAEKELKSYVGGSLIRQYMNKKDLEKAPVDVSIKTAADPDKIRDFVDTHCDGVLAQPQDASIRRENGAFVITESVLGKVVDADATASALDTAFEGLKDSNGEISVQAVIIEEQPAITSDDLKTIEDVLGTCTTDFSSSGAARSTNLAVGAGKINGRVLMPGEVISGYECLQPFTLENGYKTAAAYENGQVVDSIGGGVCQIATTLYDAALQAEMEIVQRQNHSMIVTYVKPSMDAAIAGTYKDIKIKNNYSTPVYIEGYTSGKKLTFTLYGKETRPSNRQVEYVSETIGTTNPGEPQMITDKSLAPGAKVKVQSAHTGYKSRLWKVVTVDGVEQERTLLNEDTYNASKAIYRVGPAHAAPAPVPEQTAPATTPETAENHTPETAQTEPAQTEAEHKAVTGENGGPGVVPTTAAQPAGDNAGAESPASPAQEENP